MAKVLQIQDKKGGTTSITTASGFLAWRKKWAADNGNKKPAGVGVALETPSGEALVTRQLSGCDVWKAV